MGTVFSFDLRDPVPPGVLASVVEDLREMQRMFTTYAADSSVNRLDRGEIDLSQCPPVVSEVLDLCDQIRRETGGWFDVRAGGSLDPSGLVKGWAVQRASLRLREAGYARHCLNGGGDIYAAGSPAAGRAWRVGIADPYLPGTTLAVTVARDEGIATSGPSERGAQVIDPFSGEPATGLGSVTVQGPDLARADAYATAAVAMGPGCRDWLSELSGYEALVVAEDGALWHTPGWGGGRAEPGTAAP